MSGLADAWVWLLAMGVLILFSALFSGSEAALFSLDHRSRRSLRRAGLGGNTASRLLEDPEQLLSAILFWNLLINMIYFAIAASIGGKLESNPVAGRSIAIVFTAISLLTIIFFSEMLPKSVALLAPMRIAVFVAPPLLVAVRVVRPLLPLVRATNLAVSRLLWPGFEPEREIELADIARAVELSTDDAALIQRERMALSDLVEMAKTRVNELMYPRNKLWITDDVADRTLVSDGIPPNGYWMITDASGKIAQAVGVRMLRPSQSDDLASAAEPVIYVPWSALASQVLDKLNLENLSIAIVVDEFGEILGALSIDDILHSALAPSSIQQIGPDHYRLLGGVSVRSLSKRLGIEVSEEGVTTVAGYIQRHNERLPRRGDTATMDRFELTVTDQQDDAVWIEVRLNPSLGKEQT